MGASHSRLKQLHGSVPQPAQPPVAVFLPAHKLADTITLAPARPVALRMRDYSFSSLSAHTCNSELCSWELPLCAALRTCTVKTPGLERSQSRFSRYAAHAALTRSCRLALTARRSTLTVN